MSYVPELDDYVIWNTNPQPFEGWVYFKCDQYITIEIGVKCKDEVNISDCPIHKKTHCLLLCFTENWGELDYVKNRRNGVDADLYKSQEHRYSDP
jgi:hypothetical protein